MAKINARVRFLATMGGVTPEEIAAVVRRALRTRNTTAFRAARDAGLPGNAIRHLLEGRDSRISRLAEICDALGLELYVGRPRAHPGGASAVRESAPVYGTNRAPDRSGGAARHKRRRSRHAGDRDRDWFEGAIEPLREEYRVMDSDGRASMLVRLVSAFLEVGTPPDRGAGM